MYNFEGGDFSKSVVLCDTKGEILAGCMNHENHRRLAFDKVTSHKVCLSYFC
jgi:hypothetical protein